MQEIILKNLEESMRITEAFVSQNAEQLLSAAKQIATCLAAGRKLLIFGNGGSAADAQHLAAEFVNRFMVERRPLPALALTTDTSVLTSIANDYSFDEVFSKQIKALGQKDDIAWGISTSGGSKNVILAMAAARDKGLYTLGFSGRGGGELAPRCDSAFIVGAEVTARVQEAHMTAGHILCELVERILFPEDFMEE